MYKSSDLGGLLVGFLGGDKISLVISLPLE